MSPEEMKAFAETLEILSSMAAARPNEWLPLYAALGGAIAGAIASFFPTWLLEKRREASFSKQVENCLIAEISALVDIIDRRDYLSDLKNAIEFLTLKPDGERYRLFVDVPMHYSRVYQDNCKNIGVVRARVAREIIAFHQLIDAVVQDLKPDGPFREGATLETFRKMEEISKHALCIGRRLAEKHGESAH